MNLINEGFSNTIIQLTFIWFCS